VSLFLFLAALLGGALNALAGGGSFIVLPALLYAGVPAVAANATNTCALWPGSLSAAWALRREIMQARTWLLALSVVSLIGGLAGGLLLVKTSDSRFLSLLPWLMLIAAVTFTFGDRFTRRLTPGRAQPMSPLAIGAQLLIATYGGYFGGGMGIMTLAALSIAGMDDIHEMNGVKLVMAAVINGASLVEFAIGGVVVWRLAIVMAGGGVIGGWVAATLARRFDQRYVRALIIAVAWGLTVYFFVR